MVEIDDVGDGGGDDDDDDDDDVPCNCVLPSFGRLVEIEPKTSPNTAAHSN